jgi:hypothetical protein
MTSEPDFDWATHDGTRIRLGDLFHDWRVTWDELQQQRAGGVAAHRDLIERLAGLEEQIEQLLPTRSALPS